MELEERVAQLEKVVLTLVHCHRLPEEWKPASWDDRTPVDDEWDELVTPWAERLFQQERQGKTKNRKEHKP